MTTSLPEGRRGLPRLWLVDTSSLVTMAAHGALRLAVTGYLTEEHAAAPATISHELHGLKHAPPPTAQWANLALTQLGWLGTPLPVTQGTPVFDTAVDIQDDMAAESPLEREDEHWGESAIIAIGKHLNRLDAIMLSEDYNARVAATNRHQIASMSLAKLMQHMVLDDFRTAAQAEGFTQALVQSRRWKQDAAISAQDFIDGRLARRGRP